MAGSQRGPLHTRGNGTPANTVTKTEDACVPMNNPGRSASFWKVIPALALAACAPSLQAQSARALEVLHERLLPVFEVAGVVFTDVDESTGRLKVGVLHRDVEGLVRERLPAMGILSQLVDVVETEPIVQLTTLRDKVRPAVGGLQIRFNNYVCTLGFPAVRDGVWGFVTNNHCSSKQGSVDGTNYYQPLNQIADEFIGVETVDPPYFRGPTCPRGKQCRYSDSIFVRGATGVIFDRGKIAKTGGFNTGSLTIDSEFIISDVGSAPNGATVNKVGRTTGWTQGIVTSKCANVGVQGTNIVNLCQDMVENKTAKIVDGGDSGSQVFQTSDGVYAKLVGLLWGGNANGTLFVYSPFENVQQELGTLSVMQ